MGLYSVYYSLVLWLYPLKDYLGETGCYLIMYWRTIGSFAIQLQSFFMALFRYICLFHNDSLFKFNLSPNVSKVLLAYTYKTNVYK